MNRLAASRLGAYLFVVVVGAGGMWRVETTASRAQEAAERAQEALDQLEADRLEARQARCLKDDEDNANDRRAILDGGITTGTTSGEAIITISQQGGRPPDPAVIEAYRQVQLKLLRPALEGIANTFPKYRWDPKSETCVEVPMDTGG